MLLISTVPLPNPFSRTPNASTSRHTIRVHRHWSLTQRDIYDSSMAMMESKYGILNLHRTAQSMGTGATISNLTLRSTTMIRSGSGHPRIHQVYRGFYDSPE